MFSKYPNAYHRSLTLKGWEYYKRDGFFLRAIRKSDYIEGKLKEKLAIKEINRLKKELRNT